MLRFHRVKFLLTAVGALGLIASNVAKNIIHFKAGTGGKEDMLGLADVLEWVALAVIAFSVAMHPQGGFTMSVWAVLPFLASAGIGLGERLYRRDGFNAVGQATFAVSLFALAGLAGHASPGALVTALGGALLLTTGTLFAIPWQKSYAMVDGPGGYMVGLGWLLIVFANSLFNEGK